MAVKPLPKGIVVSFSNTPQANDDFLAAALTEDSAGPVTLDVMANDLGGNAKSLYALDDGVGSTGPNGDLLEQDAIGAANRSAHGATIKITADGKISYDATTLDPSFRSDLQHLSAGEFATDTFTYAIRLGNGALSWATATIQIAGVNDAPVAENIATTANEDSGNPVVLTASYADIDAHDTHTFTIDTAGTKGAVVNNGDGTFSYDPNGQFESLALGETATDTFSYTVTDSRGASSTRTATVTIHGENDAPVAVADNASVKEDSAPNPISGNVLTGDTDVDTLDTHSVTAVNGTAGNVGHDLAGMYGTLHLNTDGSYTYLLDNTKASVQALAQEQTVHDVFSYTNSDNNLATSSSTLTIDVAGSNDAPTLQDPVPTGQILDETSLTLTATMAFADVDLPDSHAITFTALTSGSIGTFTSAIHTDSTGSGHGAIDLSYHLTKDEFDAAGGQPPDHLDYRVTIDDHHGGVTSKVVSIPLAQILEGNQDGGGGNPGPNHAPVITHSTADEMAGGRPLTAFVWDDPTVGILHASGFLDFEDPDAGDPHHVQVFAAPDNWGHLGTPLLVDSPPSGGHGQIDWQYSVDESAVRPLAAGKSHNSDQFVFRLFDSTGAFVDHTVNVSIFGADEPPVVPGPSNIIVNTSAGGPIHLDGTFAFNDADLSDTHHLETFPTPDGFGGIFATTLVHDTVNGTGGQVHWTYDLDPVGLQYLAAGESVSETLPVMIFGNNDALRLLGAPVDNHGMMTIENITFVINGVNDDPYFRTPPVIITESPFLGSIFGVHRADNIGFGDVDNNDTHIAFARFNSSASTGGEVGHLNAYVDDDTTGGTNVNGIIHWDYDADTTALGTTPIHQVYDIVLQDNHGGQTIQSFVIDLSPHF